MPQLRCPFEDCRCVVASMDEKRKIQVPEQVYTKMKLLQNSRERTLRGGQFLVFDDVWDFDNIGVSRSLPVELRNATSGFALDDDSLTVNEVSKYLICADCDRGPLGAVCEVKTADGGVKVVHLLSLASVELEQ
ncbi:LAMI_0H13410g1_1 [Lachancea mirantina]|uniref:LAMI_0H13410g1_1 n=1 Tax=Lachancea mirantina TaxID=1230905 RepID=A0A1G4KHR7_9SACH|nr:LAMI_0H13410g1_1 [Lachancea mirantina]